MGLLMRSHKKDSLHFHIVAQDRLESSHENSISGGHFAKYWGSEAIVSVKSIVYFYCFQTKIFVLASI